MTKTTNDLFPPVRFPRKLRDDLQESANELAQERGRQKMSIADFVAEMHTEWKAKNTDSSEEG